MYLEHIAHNTHTMFRSCDTLNVMWHHRMHLVVGTGERSQ